MDRLLPVYINNYGEYLCIISYLYYISSGFSPVIIKWGLMLVNNKDGDG